ncbi:MAG: penicillin-binding protein 2 [Thermomicrobiales bacterium]|nr:penicillin-binding protein 2 [Thermomicrobiales bacterium]
MFRRKKRIPYDPPGQRKKNGKRREWKRADQVFLNRRVFVLKGFVLGGFAALATRLGYMQIYKGDFYEARTANTTRQWQVEKPVRGLIVDREGRSLAENRRVWEVRAVPAELPKRGTPERERVRSIIISALHLPEVLVIDPDAVPAGSEETIYRRVAALLEIKDVDRFIEIIEIRAKYNYLVEVEQFSDDEAPLFRAAAQELPGVKVINRFDYMVTNTAAPDMPVVLKRDVSRDIALTLEANRLYLPGIELDDTALIRQYPGGEAMSHILGYVGPVTDIEREYPSNQTAGGTSLYEYEDIIGKLGLELQMEKALRGTRGGSLTEIDSFGVETQTIYTNPAMPGRNLKLTIDLELQSLATEALREGLAFSNADREAKDRAAGRDGQYDAGAGAVVVLDPNSGEVLALASYPTYDNQLFVDGISTRKYEALTGDPNRPLVNKAAADHFPPGSVLKIFLALAALKENVVNDQTYFTCTSGIWVPYTWDESKGDSYLCWLREGDGHGTLGLVEALERSCDVYFYNLGTPEQKPEGAERNLHYRDLYYSTQEKGELHYFRGMGIQKIHHQLSERFWFGEPTGIELPFEAYGLVPDPEWKARELEGQAWAAGDTINTSIGQGYFLATPLQIAINTAAVANGGTIYRPRLIHQIVDDKGEPTKAYNPETNRKINASQSELDLVRDGMWRVINLPTGTAYEGPDPVTGQTTTKWPLSNPPDAEQIVMAGKTGTAEVGVKREDGTHEASHAWFTCYAPFDNPEVVVTVFLKEGGEGSSYAVPVADKVVRAWMEMTGKRPRGQVLRSDGQPIGRDTPAPSGEPVSEASPEAGDAGDEADSEAGE